MKQKTQTVSSRVFLRYRNSNIHFPPSIYPKVGRRRAITYYISSGSPSLGSYVWTSDDERNKYLIHAPLLPSPGQIFNPRSASPRLLLDEKSLPRTSSSTDIFFHGPRLFLLHVISLRLRDSPTLCWRKKTYARAWLFVFWFYHFPSPTLLSLVNRLRELGEIQEI